MRPLSFYNTVSVCIRVPLDNLLQTVLEFYSLPSYMYVHVSKITPFKDVFMVILLVNFIFWLMWAIIVFNKAAPKGSGLSCLLKTPFLSYEATIRGGWDHDNVFIWMIFFRRNAKQYSNKQLKKYSVIPGRYFNRTLQWLRGRALSFSNFLFF